MASSAQSGRQSRSRYAQTFTKSRKAFESRREREFYSYYDPILALFDVAPPLCDLHDQESVANHRPISSPDPALTAFTQLTALRLRARRSMLFFFDSEFAYVLAEATRTLSLHDDTQHDIDDSLWLGAAKIPRGFSVCEVTADLPVNDGSNAHDANSRTFAHIVNNLAEDTRFCDRPYVRGGPMARFYAGVPITTPKGFNIGALCVLDEQPRAGLDASELRFLKDMGQTVMKHLELVRARAESQRGYGMTTALGAFMDGRSRMQDVSFKKTARSLRPNGDTVSPEVGSVQTAGIYPDAENDVPRLVLANEDTAQPLNFEALPPPVHETQEAHFAKQIQLMLNRAASLLVNAVNVDGAAFLDATIGRIGGLVDSSRALGVNESSTEASSASSRKMRYTRIHHDVSVSPASEPVVNHCPILGSAVAPKRSNVPADLKVDDKFLRRLLRRYPEGRVWHFDVDGHASSDESSGEGFDSPSVNDSPSSDTEVKSNVSPSARRARKRLQARLKDGRTIQKLLPGVRSFMLVGMWDPHKERWFGASVLWSFSPTRILSDGKDLTYTAAFCDVVLAEVWRKEARMIDRSKNDFISSISHELRSPLHGILGNAEYLEDRQSDPLNQEMIRSILACGTTLLDVVNNLLEHSGLEHNENHHEGRAGYPWKADLNLSSPGVAVFQPHPGIRPNESCSLSEITEDAINALCSGVQHSNLTFEGRRPSENSVQSSVTADQPITINLDIQEFWTSSWAFAIDGSAWRRVCANLVSNALKFTRNGYVNVTLAKKWLSKDVEGQKCALVSLTVEDTGVGMSAQFQSNDLFKPFRQENGLSQGTGLGLYHVAHIVKSYEGTVTVKSQKGQGTAVTVTLTLVSAPLCASTESPGDSRNSALPHAGILIELHGFDLAENAALPSSVVRARRELDNSLRKAVMQMGAQVLESGIQDISEGEVIIIHGSTIRALASSGDLATAKCTRKPMVVVCQSRETAIATKTLAGGHISSDLQIIWLPIGPQKLSTAISAACASQKQASIVTFASAPIDAMPVSPRQSAIQVPIVTKDCHSTTLRQSDPSVGMSDSTAATTALKPPNIPEEVEKSVSTSVRERRPSKIALVAAEPHATKADKEQHSTSLLLVDDNSVNLRLLVMFADKAGYTYRTAEDGMEAVEGYKRAVEESSDLIGTGFSVVGNSITRRMRKPDVILMDINMPIMDGYEATRRIRAYEEEQGLTRSTIIALTGLGNVQAQTRAIECGMDLFLTKPVRLKDLAKILAQYRSEHGSQG